MLTRTVVENAVRRFNRYESRNKKRQTGFATAVCVNVKLPLFTFVYIPFPLDLLYESAFLHHKSHFRSSTSQKGNQEDTFRI